jgi:glycine cleavage system regulatory protein
MMTSTIITLIGKDKPGLLDSLARQVYDLEGNWLGSSFSHMAGYFAGFAEIAIPKTNLQKLIDTFNAHPDLQIQIVQGENTNEQGQSVILEIVGNDRPGIVQELSNVFSQFAVNIVGFDSWLESAPNWGGDLFKAKAKIVAPTTLDLNHLQNALEALANDLVIDLKSMS